MPALDLLGRQSRLDIVEPSIPDQPEWCGEPYPKDSLINMSIEFF